MSQERLRLDISYTRTQQGTIGITRTVRRMHEALSRHGALVDALAFHGEGFRIVPFETMRRPGGQADTPSAGERLFAWVTGGLARRLVLVALRLVPWRWLQRAWEISAAATFNALSRDAAPATFQAGDILVLADVGWNYPVWKPARQARSQGAAVVLVVYDLMPIRHPEFCFGLVPHVFAACLREMIAVSDALLCISPATEDDLRAWAAEQGLRLPPTGYFHLGSDPFPGGAGAVRTEITAFLAAPAVCFSAVGSFEPKKNYALLAQVFEHLWEQGVQARLLIAGKKTADCAAFVEALRVHPQQGRLLMTVHDATDAEVAAIYNGSRALVLPSLFEGFGLALVEARARGCRVLASDIPPFAELADGGVTLFPSDDADALERAVRAMLEDGPPVAPARARTWDERH